MAKSPSPSIPDLLAHVAAGASTVAAAAGGAIDVKMKVDPNANEGGSVIFGFGPRATQIDEDVADAARLGAKLARFMYQNPGADVSQLVALVRSNTLPDPGGKARGSKLFAKRLERCTREAIQSIHDNDAYYRWAFITAQESGGIGLKATRSAMKYWINPPASPKSQGPTKKVIKKPDSTSPAIKIKRAPAEAAAKTAGKASSTAGSGPGVPPTKLPPSAAPATRPAVTMDAKHGKLAIEEAFEIEVVNMIWVRYDGGMFLRSFKRGNVASCCDLLPKKHHLKLLLKHIEWFKQAGQLETYLVACHRASNFSIGPLSRSDAQLLRTHADRDKLLAAGDPLPEGKQFKVYRGVSGEGLARRPSGYSWTTDPSVACDFALRGNRPNPAVYQATVARSDVMFYCNARDEQEIFAWIPRTKKLNMDTSQIKEFRRTTRRLKPVQASRRK